MAGFHQLLTFFTESTNIGLVYSYMGVGRKGMEVGWVVAKAKTKKQDDTSGRV